MLPDNRSTSFTFHKNIFSSSPKELSHKNLRQKLENRFDNYGSDDEKENVSERNVLRSITSLSNLSETKKVFRTGAEKITKTLNTVKIKLDTISQKFRISTKRRAILEEGPSTPSCNTPVSRSRQVLGRTPTKLYSPFGIETPIKKSPSEDKENTPFSNLTNKMNLSKTKQLSNRLRNAKSQGKNFPDQESSGDFIFFKK